MKTRIAGSEITAKLSSKTSGPGRRNADALPLAGRGAGALLLLSALLQMGCAAGVPNGFTNPVGGSSNPGQLTVPPPPITVTLNLSSASVTPGGNLTLGVTVSGATDPTVLWDVNGIPGGNQTVGTISSQGSYTAPAQTPVPNTVIITATSVQDPSKVATATVVIAAPPTPVVVALSPAASTVQTLSSVAFTALVTGTANTAVTWSVNGIPGGNATFGTITGTGIYTAPAAVPAPATISIQANSVADPTASGFASLTVQQQVMIVVNPAAAQVQTFFTQQFGATVSGTATQTVAWSVNGVSGGNATVGTIDGTGLFTAPVALPPGATMVTVSAVSAVDPTAMGTASVALVLSPGVVVTVSPTVGQLNINQSQQYTAMVSGLFQGVPPSPNVTWSVNLLPGGTPAFGTIDANGLYTAPPAVPFPNTVTITATSTTDQTAQANATLQIVAPTLVIVTTAPAAASVQVGLMQQFTASVAGTPNQGVTWSVNGVPGGNSIIGTVDATGLYTAPAAVPAPASVLVSAASTIDPTAMGSSMVTVSAAPVPVMVAVSPTTAMLHVLDQLQFMSTVTGSANQAVTWTLSGAGCAGATCGTIDATGLYIAPSAVPAPPTVMATATSVVAPMPAASAVLTILPPTSITINPMSTTVQTGAGVQFFVTVTGVANTAVVYDVNGVAGGNSTLGTINANGLYLAPNSVPATNPVTVSATSVADPTLVAMATVTIAAPITVTVAPPTAMLVPGGMQMFAATVTGTMNLAVTWSVNGMAGGNATIGTIDAMGNYTAPASLLLTQSFTIAAASVVNPAATGSATVTVTVPVAVSVAPVVASVVAGQMQQFTATVTGTANTAVTWALSGAGCAGPACGTIAVSGLYTAPATPPVPATVTVTATSVADPTKMGTGTVTVQPGVAVSVSPTTAALLTGAMQTFVATVTGSGGNTAVTWSVNGVVGGNATVGMIDVAGNYTAPATVPTPSTVTVTATSQADTTKSASATVTISAPVSVMVSPAGVSLGLGQMQQFTATVTGSPNTAVTWTLTQMAVACSPGCGTITTGGLYTAPAVLPANASVTVTATSQADMTKSASATVTISAMVTVSVSPGMVGLVTGSQQQFTATVTGSPDTSVTWTLTQGGMACAPACGMITAAGLYTAPAAVPANPNVTVTATSNADNTKTASAMVTVNPPVAVTIAPTMATVPAGQTQQFSTTVTGTANTAVTFTLSGANCSGATCGTITAGGLYTAPLTPPSPNNTVSVTATSVADNTKTATATVTVTPSVSVTITPLTAFLNTLQMQQFTATVTGTMNTAVTWSVNGVVGGDVTAGMISLSGQYTAPASTPTPATVTVTATSAFDTTKSAAAMVTITTPAVGVLVTVFPQSKNLPAGRTQQFRAHVIRSNNPTVTWAVNGIAGGNAMVGTIDATGLYTPPAAPAALPMAIMVRATSQADPTASMTVNATVVVNVVVSPASAKILAGQSQQFTAAVSGTATTTVTWAVNGVAGGNAAVGTINAAGLYTVPAALAPPGMFTISATSTVDGTEPGIATLMTLARITEIGPRNAQVLPGGRMLFQSAPSIYPPPITNQALIDWSVGGIIGGNATVGTITPAGVYTAPQTAATTTVTVRVASTVDPTRTDQTMLTIITPGGLSPQVGFVGPLQKIRPYDTFAGAVTPITQTIEAVGNQYASTQILVQARNEELMGVNFAISNFSDGAGNTIPASNATLYFEKFINASYVSRAQGDIGEWPDALIPKVDPFVGETRNAFPFNINRISPAYKRFPRAGGETVNTGMGAGRVTSSGSYTGMFVKHYVVEITQGGTATTARYRWSDNGGVTFAQSNVLAGTAAAALNDGVMVSFQNGGVAGVNDFNAGDTFWIFAATQRNQPVWLDLFIPGTAPAGTYTGSITVMRAGKANVTLTLSVLVKTFSIPVTSSVPSYVGMNWTDLLNAHFNVAAGPQTLSLGHLYGVACLINRVSCDTASAFPPTYTFNADGTVASSNYAAYDQATAPLANGTITPHGEQLTSMRMPRAGVNDSQTYFATQNMVQFFNTRNWYPRVFDYSADEPGTLAELLAAMDRTSLIRSASNTTRVLVTTDISAQNYNLTGYVNRWTPNWASLDRKEFLEGPNPASRSFYNKTLTLGDELWWFESCRSHGCATGTSPRHDNIVSLAFDTSALINRAWGLLASTPYRVNGFLYQNATLAYSRFFNMTAPKIDVWESVYYLGGNGDGTLFYPGRPADIGGTTHIPIESLRLKMIREALVQQEIALFLIARGDELFLQQQAFNGLQYNIYTYNPSITSYTNISSMISTQAASPPAPPPVTVPPLGQCYNDPVTGARVCTVTNATLCLTGGKHNYSFWPIWNQSGSHFIVECGAWVGGGGVGNFALLIRDSDLAVIGDALQGAPGGLNTLKLLWSWTDPNRLYGNRGGEVHEWNPFTLAGTLLKNFSGLMFAGKTVGRADLAYVSFDDRYFLMEFYQTGIQFGIGVWDRVTNTVTFLDTSFFSFYDESVFTKDGGVWVVGDIFGQTHSFRYVRDFSSRVRVADHGHHGHGLLPDGTAVAVKETARQCPAGSVSGSPPGVGWQPGALILNESIDTSVNPLADPFPSEMRRLGCQISGRHHFGHFSWNNTQTDRFFISSNSYSGFATDPLAHAILRVRMQFGGTGQITGDQFDVIARHNSDDNLGYFALPRVACNQQGSRCLFASSMTINTTNTSQSIHLYVVDIPNP